MTPITIMESLMGTSILLIRAIGAIPAQVTQPERIAADCEFA